MNLFMSNVVKSVDISIHVHDLTLKTVSLHNLKIQVIHMFDTVKIGEGCMKSDKSDKRNVEQNISVY